VLLSCAALNVKLTESEAPLNVMFCGGGGAMELGRPPPPPPQPVNAAKPREMTRVPSLDMGRPRTRCYSFNLTAIWSAGNNRKRGLARMLRHRVIPQVEGEARVLSSPINDDVQVRRLGCANGTRTKPCL
jgi:hypothetical protein